MKTTTRKRLAISLTALALLGVGGVATTASFGDSTSVTTVAEMGTIEITAGGSKTFELSNISNALFQPGRTVEQTFELANGGNLPATANIASNITGDSSLASQLIAKVEVVGKSTPAAYNGPLSGLKLNGINLAAASKESIKVTVSAPESIANSMQGKKVSVSLTVTATQK